MKTKKIHLSMLLLIVAMLSACGHAGITDFYVQSVASADHDPDDPAAYMIEWLEVDGTYYLMVPNSADITNLNIHFEASSSVFAGSYELISGEYTNIFAGGDPITLMSGRNSYEVIAMQSSEIATLFIQTESGHLDDIHDDKSHRETAQVLMICDDGETILYNGEADRFNGRGNTTWLMPKRPYSIRLAEPTDLLGTGDAQHRHWALLADYLDHSRLRNTISHSLAQEVGLEAAVRVRPVDVYINNEYMGLYLLTERVRIDTILPITDLEAATEDVNDDRLDDFPQVGVMEFEVGTRRYFDIPYDPPDITGGYLLELQFSERYDADPSAFVTTRGQAFMLGAPEFASRVQMDYISTFVQELEDAIYSSTGYNELGRHYTDYIDERSFAMMYVFQEFIMDLDAVWSSFFLYKESDLVGDGLLRAAPPWDFDQTLGRLGAVNLDDLNEGFYLADPETFWVNVGVIYDHPDEMPHMMAALWQHESFQELSVEIWNEVFAPVVVGLLDESDVELEVLESVRGYEAGIRDSVEMEWVHWGIDFSFDEEVEFVIDFIERRIEFLDEQWGE